MRRHYQVSENEHRMFAWWAHEHCQNGECALCHQAVNLYTPMRMSDNNEVICIKCFHYLIHTGRPIHRALRLSMQGWKCHGCDRFLVHLQRLHLVLPAERQVVVVCPKCVDAFNAQPAVKEADVDDVESFARKEDADAAPEESGDEPLPEMQDGKPPAHFEQVSSGSIFAGSLSYHANTKRKTTFMDVIFNCPKCEQELAVDASWAGSEIECPACGEALIIPEPESALPRTGVQAEAPPIARVEPHPVNPIASSAAAKVEMHLRVPTNKSSESLIAKPLPPMQVAAKDSDKRIRVKTIKHTGWIEVGHDKFDEIVSNFLGKVGETNIVSITPLTYTFLDIGTQKLLTESGVLIVYKGWARGRSGSGPCLEGAPFGAGAERMVVIARL